MRCKKLLSLVLAAAMCLTVLPVGAMADEPTDQLGYEVAVRVNGDLLQFPDAQPTIVNTRTMLPVRALVESMGALVEWDGDTYQVKITLDGTVVTLTIGSRDITVEKNGETTTATMDVAPFIDSVFERTYVPVRFVSEAFGYEVGWDDATRTAAILMGGESLMSRLLEGKSFHSMEQVAGLLTRTREEEGIQVTTALAEGAVTVGGMLQIPMAMELKAVTEAEVGMEMTVGMTVDLSTLQALAFSLALMGYDILGDETTALLNLFSQGEVRETFRYDMASGQLYYTLSDALLTAAGMESGTWFRQDLGVVPTQETGTSLSAALLKMPSPPWASPPWRS